jgi:hypothetical protein
MRRTDIFTKLWRVSLVIAVLALTCSVGLATSAVVMRNATLRRNPSTATRPIRTLLPGDEVELISATPQNGYYNVRTEDGDEGWVYGRSITIRPEATPSVSGNPSDTPGLASAPGVTASIDTNWEKPAPNQTTFSGEDGECGPAGDGGDSKTNPRKNRTDVPTQYHDVTWAAIAKLPYPSAPRSLDDWTPDQLSQIAPFEGIAVRTVGYIVKIKVEDSGSGESTNCHFTKPTEVDWHVPLVEAAGNGENTSVVVETTPRVRLQHPNWTPQALAPWVDSNLPVRISGYLLLDPEHRNHLGKFRSTLWEIHPVLMIEVFQSGNWVNLDQVH